MLSEWFALSSDVRYLLFACYKTPEYRHSFRALYYIFEVNHAGPAFNFSSLDSELQFAAAALRCLCARQRCVDV